MGQSRGGKDWTSFVLKFMHMHESVHGCVRVCSCSSLWLNVGKWEEVNSEREGRGRVSKWRRGWDEGRGVNFNMSFLKLSFDNWQFVQLVKCQESKKIDEVHNRCLRLTLRCGLESHARMRPPKRYRNEISHMYTQRHIYTHTNTRTWLLESTSDMENWSTSI